MPGRTQIITLPAMTQTSSAVDTSTGPVPAWDVSDARAVTFTWVGDTTAPGPKVQVAYTLETTATFSILTYNTSGASPVISSSGIAVTVDPISFKQMRIVTTAIHTGTQTATGSKLIIV